MIYENYIENGTVNGIARDNILTKYFISASDVNTGIPGATTSVNVNAGLSILAIDPVNLTLTIPYDWTNRRSLNSQNQIIIKRGNIVKKLEFTKVHPTTFNSSPATEVLLSYETSSSDLIDFISLTGATGTAYLGLYPQNEYPENAYSRNLKAQKLPLTNLLDDYSVNFSWDNISGVSQNILRWRAIPDSRLTTTLTTKPLYTGLTGISAIAVNSDGDLYYTTATSVFRIVKGSTFASTLLTGLTAISGIALGPTGGVYVSSSSSTSIYCIPSGQTGSTAISLGYTGNSGLAVGSQGQVYVSNSNKGTIYQIAPTGAVSTVVNKVGAPQAISIDTSGNLYFTSLTGGSGYVYFIPAGATSAALVTSISQAEAITVDGGLNIYVTDSSGNLNVIKTGGNVAVANAAFIVQNGTITTTTYSLNLSNPHGITIGSTGSIYISEKNSGKITTTIPVTSTSGMVDYVSVVSGGFGYTSGQSLSFSGGGGTGASAIIEVTATSNYGKVVGFQVVYEDAQANHADEYYSGTYYIDMQYQSRIGNLYDNFALDSNYYLPTDASMVAKIVIGDLPVNTDLYQPIDVTLYSSSDTLGLINFYFKLSDLITPSYNAYDNSAIIQAITQYSPVASVLILDRGSGYTSAPTATISGGGALATLQPVVSMYADWNYVTMSPAQTSVTVLGFKKNLQYEWQLYSTEGIEQPLCNFSASQTLKIS
jgi:sugar lactone lactonase YvrE